ncbi:hypothetical protein COV24_03765 [candidate division WWE3 bacterium CG10_big_fil_rev_8_21_14_0_10_32_10]|uniref:Metallo-beta-lactamase domain-containing protein n=1 Tax=candidate division WWE3 bacterium CG10_big_fil_rev_8_21_14_0_10_32_10 TaxID=1975090 RepID=A0A2H0R9N2_UNCKA|nr:MAG: hypothetical protein COV24_03765 [candidate division WWE3 bacterium CG10_big_fil_rev_8_21_14_0_10_32_10]
MSALKIFNLGGVSVQKNMYIYEYEDEAIIVDCGIGFPESDDFGVDIVIPDFDYVLSIKDKIKGLVLTHAHEDHYSATPFLLRDMSLTIYSHPIVKGFLENKLKDYKNYNKPTFKEISDSDTINIGKNFTLYPYRVNHSVPSTMGFYIKTPAGVVVHQTDFKFDWTPVMDKPTDVQKIASLSKQLNPLLLLSDSLGSTSPGFTLSEKFIEDTFNEIVKDSKGQVFITTISSNISRIQQAINCAITYNRKVIISGYSIEKNVDVAMRLQLLKIEPGTIISEADASKFRDDQILYIVPGTYGQVGSTLDKVAKGDHRTIKLHEGATVAFSSDPIPGTEPLVDKMIDELTLKGAHVVYSEIQDQLHVSGHGSRGDLTLMAHLVNPTYFSPIGGGIKHMRAYKDMISDQGFKAENIFELQDGESLIVENNTVKKGEVLNIKDIFIDNNQDRSSVDNIVLKDRKLLADSGVIFVVIPFRGEDPLYENCEIYTRGFIFVKENQSLLKGMRKNVSETVKSLKGNKESQDFTSFKKAVEKALAKHLYKRVGEAPVIVVEKLEL